MNEKIIELNKIFENNKGKYIYSNIDLIDFYEIESDEYRINIKLFKQEAMFKLFIFLESKDKLLFKGLLDESSNNLVDKFNLYKDDLNNKGINTFIDEYYETLKACY